MYNKIAELLQNNIYIRNFYVQKLNDYLETDNIIIIQGQRRVGKSFVVLGFLKQLQEKSEYIFYINKEQDEKDIIKNTQDLSDLFEQFVAENGEPKYIIIDEVQDIYEREKFIRSKYASKKYKIIITGSNSKLLSGELATYLTGRYVNIEVGSFDYQEYLDYHQVKHNKNLFNDYLKYGGLPEIIILKNEELKNNYLKNTTDSIVFKDIINRYNIKEFTLIYKICSLLGDNLGSLFSIRNVCNYINTNQKTSFSTATISNYIKYIQNTYILQNCQRYDIKGKKILEQIEKYYFSDIGIRNTFGFDITTDIGKILENLVYLKYKKYGYNIYIGSIDGGEIDFVVSKGGVTKYIQVSYLINDKKVKEREFGNLSKIKNDWPKIVISMDDIAGGFDKSGIQRINIIDFLLSNNI